MSPRIKTRIAFIGRSMLWSLLLYVVMMLAINWDDVQYVLNNRHVAHQQTYAGAPSATDANITARTGIVYQVVSVLKAITAL